MEAPKVEQVVLAHFLGEALDTARVLDGVQQSHLGYPHQPLKHLTQPVGEDTKKRKKNVQKMKKRYKDIETSAGFESPYLVKAVPKYGDRLEAKKLDEVQQLVQLLVR